MGANQSQTNGAQTNQHGITIVNPDPIRESAEIQVQLPNRVSPILTIDSYQIDSSKHPKEFQLDYQLWVDYVTMIEEIINSKVQIVATKQGNLQEKIISLEDHVQKFTDSYVNDTHKALARMNEDCKKVEELNQLLHKCTVQSELCVDMLNKLNFFLPDEKKLEKIEP